MGNKTSYDFTDNGGSSARIPRMIGNNNSQSLQGDSDPRFGGELDFTSFNNYESIFRYSNLSDGSQQPLPLSSIAGSGSTDTARKQHRSGAQNSRQSDRHSPPSSSSSKSPMGVYSCLRSSFNIGSSSNRGGSSNSRGSPSKATHSLPKSHSKPTSSSSSKDVTEEETSRARRELFYFSHEDPLSNYESQMFSRTTSSTSSRRHSRTNHAGDSRSTYSASLMAVSAALRRRRTVDRPASSGESNQTDSNRVGRGEDEESAGLSQRLSRLHLQLRSRRSPATTSSSQNPDTSEYFDATSLEPVSRYPRWSDILQSTSLGSSSTSDRPASTGLHALRPSEGDEVTRTNGGSLDELAMPRHLLSYQLLLERVMRSTSSEGEDGPSSSFVPRMFPRSSLLSFTKSTCPICRMRVPHEDYAVHYVCCLTKPKLSYKEEVLTEEKGECAICLEEMELSTKVARLSCSCVYHVKCIDSWFQKKEECPMHPSP